MSIGCPFTCALHYGMKHLKAMGKSQFKLPGWILKLVWDLSFTLVHCSTNMQCLLFTNDIVVGKFTTGELGGMCVRCLGQYVQFCWD